MSSGIVKEIKNLPFDRQRSFLRGEEQEDETDSKHEEALRLNLASEELGARVLYASNEFFAEAHNLLKPGRGIFLPDEYTVNGKWMDGWETSRHGTHTRGGVDFCIIKLGALAHLKSIDVDTNHFKGNYAQYASISACRVEGDPAWFYLTDESNKWTEIVPTSELVSGDEGHGHNIFTIASHHQSSCWTHLKLNIRPDGGVARLKVYGDVVSRLSEECNIDLAAVHSGGKPVSCSNMFFSSPWNLLMPGRAKNMSSGWETKRSRATGHKDWVIIKLGCPAVIDAVEVDTTHFRGNPPHAFSIHGADLSAVEEDNPSAEADFWKEVVEKTRGKPHFRMVFRFDDLKAGSSVFTHIKLTVHPDGGVSRLRVYGKKSATI